MRPTVPPEFSRPLRVDDLGPAGRSFHAVATECECAALATRFGLVLLSRFEVSGAAAIARGGTAVLVSARLVAEVTQECVVTLAPIVSELVIEFERLYADDAAGGAANADEDIYFDVDQDDFDPLVDGCADVGEAAAEQLALELDPYPRAPGARLQAAAEEDSRSSPAPASPFAAIGGFPAPLPQTKRCK